MSKTKSPSKSPSRNVRETSKEYKIFAKGPSRLEAVERKVKFAPHPLPIELVQVPDLSQPTRSPAKRKSLSPTTTSPFSVKRSGSPIRRQQIQELEQGVLPKRRKTDDDDVKTITFEAMVMRRFEELESRISSIEATQETILTRLRENQ